MKFLILLVCLSALLSCDPSSLAGLHFLSYLLEMPHEPTPTR
jgi:hypothetical protein